MSGGAIPSSRQTASSLLTPDGEAWRKPAHRRFLVPGYALSTVFRAKLRDGLARAGNGG